MAVKISYRATVLVGAEPEGAYRVPNARATPKTLYGPRGVYCDDTLLVVADTGNHRVLIWSGSISGADRRDADVVLGQPDMYSDSPNAGGHPEKGLFMPTGVHVDERKRLWVADAWNHRILLWEDVPDTNFREPDHVIGQPDKLSTERNILFWCFGVFFSESMGLFVCDTGNRRVLHWKGVPDSLEQPDDIYEGYSWPHTLSVLDNLICLADAGTGISKVFLYKNSMDNCIGIWGKVEGCCREGLNLPYVVSALSLSPKLNSFLLKIKEALDLFNSVGAYPQKVDYYEKVGWMEILKASLMKKRSPKKADIPWDRIKRSIIERLSFDPFEEVKRVSIDETFIEKAKGGRHIVILVADLLYSLIEEVEEKRDVVYRELYERLERLREEYVNREKSAEEILKDLLKVKKEKEEIDITIRSLSEEEKIIFNIRHVLKSKGYDVKELKKTKDVLKEILSKKVISPTLWDRLRKALHMDLIGSIKDVSKRDRIINTLVEEFIKPFLGV